MMSKSYFSAHELRCRCNRPDCDAKPMKVGIVMKANALRALYGKPLHPSSGRRCLFWNKHEGGSPKSQHPEGNAIDFLEYNRAEQDKIAELAEKVGCGGIGLYDWGVHIDDGPAGRRWNYRTTHQKISQ